MSGGGTLWIHVGTHKTGSTSIQKALHRCKAGLNAVNVAVYPESNAWALANLFIRPELQTTPRLSGWVSAPTPAEFDAGLKDMRQICRGPHSGVVVSSEEFCLLRGPQEAESLRSSLGKMFSRIIPVVVLRNVADWRASRCDQLKKTGNWEAQKALPDAQSTDGEWYYDTAAILAFWSQLGQVIALNYDQSVASKGSILPDFAQAIGQDGLFDEVDLRLNTRSDTPARMSDTQI